MPDQLKLTLSYDGTEFAGWARQPGKRTVEGELRAALDATFATYDDLTVAGRTDAGVHALANVVSVSTTGGPPVERALEPLNAALPHDAAVIASEPAEPEFNARFSANARSYRYRVWRRRERSALEARRALWHPQAVDLDRLNASAALLPGTHDFRAFTPAETHHKVFVRTIREAAWHDRGDVVEFEITADAFLRHMVRTLVGTMLEMAPDEIEPLLEGADRSAAGVTAPPWGLFLTNVEY